MKPLNRLLTRSTLLLSLSTAAIAEVRDGKDLYEIAGPDAAFVRLVNLDEAALSATIEDKVLKADGLCSVSETKAVIAGNHILQGEGWIWQQLLKPGEIYTVIVNGPETTELSSLLDRDPMKASFEVLNLSSSSELDVLTVEGKRSVFNAIPKSSRVSRSLNPLRVELQLNSDSREVSLEPIAFARGKTTTLIVCDSNNSFVSTYTTE